MNPSMPLPKYHQVYLVLREQIHDGRFASGLPGELVLQQQFGVARVTVRRALEQLRLEGLIAREPGRGTRPLADGLSREATSGLKAKRASLTGLLENLVSMGLKTKVKVLEAKPVLATLDIAQALHLPAGTVVNKSIRVRSTSQGPVSYITTYVPSSIAAFTRKQLSAKPILLLMEEAGVSVGRAEQTISARLADAHVAPHLQVSVGSALLAVKRLIYDTNDRPVQWLHGLYRPDRYEYMMQLSRVGDIDAKVWVNKELSAQFH